MNKEKQIDMLTELLIDFDEMGFAPTTLCPDPEAYAIEWREKLTEELKGYHKAFDVAREIFEEIEKEIEEALKSNYKVLPQIEFSNELYNSVRGKIDALRGVEGFIAELKKKYTQEK